MRITTAEARDHAAIRALYHAAFDEPERDPVADLAIALLADESTSDTLSLVARDGEAITGHVAFSPIRELGHERNLAFLLAPLAVVPDRQRLGIGSALVREGLRRLEAADVTAFLVYGDPGYYGRFGFGAETATRFRPPYPLEFPFGWQARITTPDSTPTTPVTIECVEALARPELW